MSTVWRPYIAEYRHDNSTWGFEIYAPSYKEASERLQSIRTSAKLQEEVLALVPLSLKERIAGWFR